MTLATKKTMMTALGLAGAVMLWPLLVLVQFSQAAFPDYLSFSLVQGGAFGILMGAVMGSLEGIAVSSRPKALSGALFGALFGLGAGFAGMFAGQGFLFLAGRDASGLVLALAKGAAWTIVGFLLAMTEGIRTRSARRLLAGALGGLAGGLVGGAALEFGQARFPGDPWALLAALALFGTAIALFYALFERSFSAGALRILNGPLRDKECAIVGSKAVLGSADSCDVVLKGYPGVMPRHAEIRIVKGSPRIVPLEGKVVVNEEAASDAALRREDVVALGKARLIYGFFS